MATKLFCRRLFFCVIIAVWLFIAGITGTSGQLAPIVQPVMPGLLHGLVAMRIVDGRGFIFPPWISTLHTLLYLFRRNLMAPPRKCNECGQSANVQSGFCKCDRCGRTLCPKCQRGRSNCPECGGNLKLVGTFED